MSKISLIHSLLCQTAVMCCGITAAKANTITLPPVNQWTVAPAGSPLNITGPNSFTCTVDASNTSIKPGWSLQVNLPLQLSQTYDFTMGFDAEVNAGSLPIGAVNMYLIVACNNRPGPITYNQNLTSAVPEGAATVLITSGSFTVPDSNCGSGQVAFNISTNGQSEAVTITNISFDAVSQSGGNQVPEPATSNYLIAAFALVGLRELSRWTRRHLPGLPAVGKAKGTPSSGVQIAPVG